MIPESIVLHSLLLLILEIDEGRGEKGTQRFVAPLIYGTFGRVECTPMVLAQTFRGKISHFNFLIQFLKRFYLFIFSQRGMEVEREAEKHQCVVAFRAPPSGDLAHNPGKCPDWESNWRPFSSQASTQPTEPHQSGINSIISLFIFRNKTDDCIPGYYFAYGYHYCFLEVHFLRISIKN